MKIKVWYRKSDGEIARYSAISNGKIEPDEIALRNIVNSEFSGTPDDYDFTEIDEKDIHKIERFDIVNNALVFKNLIDPKMELRNELNSTTTIQEIKILLGKIIDRL